MYCLGDKYQMPQLKTDAKRQVGKSLDDCTTPDEDVVNAIPLIYENTAATDSTLRNIIVVNIKHRMRHLHFLRLKDLLSEIVCNTPDFCMDMFAYFAARPEDVKCGQCNDGGYLDEHQRCDSCGGFPDETYLLEVVKSFEPEDRVCSSWTF